MANGLGESVKNTLLIGVRCCLGRGVFLFRALDGLKVGVWKGGDELLIRMAGVLVTGGDVSPVGPGEGGGITACSWFAGFGVVVSFVNDVSVVVPDAVIRCAWFCCGWLHGVW